MEENEPLPEESLMKEFTGQNVRVFLVNGAIISGVLEKATNAQGLIVEKDRKAVVIWRNVISMTTSLG